MRSSEKYTVIFCTNKHLCKQQKRSILDGTFEKRREQCIIRPQGTRQYEISKQYYVHRAPFSQQCPSLLPTNTFNDMMAKSSIGWVLCCAFSHKFMEYQILFISKTIHIINTLRTPIRNSHGMLVAVKAEADLSFKIYQVSCLWCGLMG